MESRGKRYRIDSYWRTSPCDEYALMNAVYKYGPVVITLAGNYIQNYQSDVLNDHRDVDCDDVRNINHAVTLVG